MPAWPSFTEPASTWLPIFAGRDAPPFWVSSKTPTWLVEEDLTRLHEQHYSHALFSPGGASVVLDLGARSGLFSLYHAAIGPHVTVLAVEEHPELFDGLAETVSRSGFGNIVCCNSRAQAHAKLAELTQGSGRLGLVKMDQHAFRYNTLEELSSAYSVDLLCGEFDERTCSPIELYRLSRRVARQFYWRNTWRKTALCGEGANGGPEVSVVVPVYNVEHYLDRCLETLIGQTLKSKEIILVDDGSRDRSGTIAEEWATRHPEVVVIHQENSGCAASRSRGIVAAKGAYVGFVDSDDWVEADMFERLFEAAATHNADVAQGGYREVYEEDGIARPAQEEFQVEDATLGNNLIKDVRSLMTLKPTIWRRIYRRSFLLENDIRFPAHIRRFDDLPFQFEVFMKARNVAVVPEIFYNYRLGRVEQDVSATDERLYVHFDIFDWLREKCAEVGRSDFEVELKKVQVNTHFWAYGRLQAGLKWDYARKASRDIFGERRMVKPREILSAAWRLSPKRGLAALAAWLLHALLPAPGK